MSRSNESENSEVYIINNIDKKKEENPRFFRASINGEMSTYAHNQRVSHQRKCHAGKMGKDGMMQSTLTGEHPQTHYFSSINDYEMLEQTTSPNPVYPIVDAWCRGCGAFNEQVPLIANCKICHKKGLFLEDDTHPTVYYTGDSDIDTEEYRIFKNNEANEGLGSVAPSPESINPYEYDEVIQKAPVVFIPILKIVNKPAYNSKVSKDKIRALELDGISHMSNMANCLTSENIVLQRWARKIHELTTNQRDNDYKPVAINTWNKILRENADAMACVNYKFEANNPTLSSKDLGNWTWKFRSADTLEKKVQMFTDAIPVQPQFKTVEFDNVIEMFGDSNIPMEGDSKYYYNPIQNWNMEYMHDLVKNENYRDVLIFEGDVLSKSLPICNAHIGAYRSHQYMLESKKSPKKVKRSKSKYFLGRQ